MNSITGIPLLLEGIFLLSSLQGKAGTVQLQQTGFMPDFPIFTFTPTLPLQNVFIRLV